MAFTSPARLLTSLALFGASLALGFGLSGGSVDAFFSARGGTSSATPALGPASASASTSAGGSEAAELLLSDLMSALAEEEPLRRAYRLQEILGPASPAQLARLWERTLAVPEPRRRAGAIQAVIDRWAVADPAGARAAVQPYRVRFQQMPLLDENTAVEAAVEKAWAQAQPEEVLAEAAAATTAGAIPEWVQLSARWALATLGQGDPARQLQALATLPTSALRDDLVEGALHRLRERDPVAAEAYLGLLSNPGSRESWRAVLLGILAQTDPAAALSRLRELAPQLTADARGSFLANNVLATIANRDPAAAVAALSGLPEAAREAAAGAMLIGWAKIQPLAALDWAREQGLQIDKVHLTSPAKYPIPDSVDWLIKEALSADYGGTLTWIRALPPGAERDALLGQAFSPGPLAQKLEVFAELSPRGQAKFAGPLATFLSREETLPDSLTQNGIRTVTEWAARLPPGENRSQAIQGLSEIQGPNLTPEKLLAQWPAPADRDAALSGLAQHLAGAETPERAPEYARRITDPALREDTFEAIVLAWGSHDEDGVQAWLKSSPDFTPEQKRVIQRLLAEPGRRR